MEKTKKNVADTGKKSEWTKEELAEKKNELRKEYQEALNKEVGRTDSLFKALDTMREWVKREDICDKDENGVPKYGVGAFVEYVSVGYPDSLLRCFNPFLITNYQRIRLTEYNIPPFKSAFMRFIPKCIKKFFLASDRLLAYNRANTLDTAIRNLLKVQRYLDSNEADEDCALDLKGYSDLIIMLQILDMSLTKVMFEKLILLYKECVKINDRRRKGYMHLIQGDPKKNKKNKKK